MCLRAFCNLHQDLTVSSAAERDLCCLETLARGIFSLQNAVLYTNFGSTGKLHYFSAVHKVRAHASYMGVTHHLHSVDLDWKKLHNDITGFASKYQIQLNESDLSYGSGTVTTYQLNEKDFIFYELKHSKPIAEYGSKLSIYSSSTSTDELSIQVKTRLIGKPSIKTNCELSETIRELLSQLGTRIGSFKWTTGQHHLGWPSELRNSTTLTFECKQIDLAVAELEPIRKIHLNLLGKYSV